MLRELVGESEWQDVREFVSPKIFKIVPFSTATRQFRKVASNYFDKTGFHEAVAERSQWLGRRQLPIKLTSRRTVELGDGATSGQLVLQLYFHQLFYGKRTLLDLRHARFGGINGKVEWVPHAFWTEWEPEFRLAAQDIYMGFYLDDDARFEAGLDVMGLLCAEDVFVEHFGGGEQHAVSFRMERFIKTFRKTLQRCKAAGQRAHPNLIPFGMYIVTLYDHLEHLGGEFDVRGAFFDAVDVEEFRIQ
ncbi:hypothetical protein FIV42_23325 [Persicimonas caeni]|uniref:Uncharacterized protein n=1 Tax=Persicimonas caeni TaxID=2292766 RepID=A0A4Y6PZY8_PERCE|nr:hypothetical protein [Persicimonas caeni]QDG53567.1 hypothetical protein FIV42_23325 [Persicimonas caeni]QED34788.1 hypothetical protein FRD00_23320 [Persicimonas caeni]